MTATRVVAMHRTIVTPADRERFFERARQLREHYTKHRCSYWLFEETELPGAFIEFTESKDPTALTAALSAAPDASIDPARIYREVEL